MSDTATRKTITALFEQAAKGADVTTLATFYSEEVDWFIPGDTTIVPWIGKKTGRAGVAEFYTQIRAQITSERFDVTDILTHGNHAVVTGSLASRVNATGKLIETNFALDITVVDNQITRYHMLEDTLAVANACRPD